MTNPEQRWEVAMPLLAAEPVTVSLEQREELEHLVRTHSTPQQLALRARIMRNRHELPRRQYQPARA